MADSHYTEKGWLWIECSECKHNPNDRHCVHAIEHNGHKGCWSRGELKNGIRPENKLDKGNNKCRCYINAKYYARQASTGGNMRGYIPCPIHETE